MRTRIGHPFDKWRTIKLMFAIAVWLVFNISLYLSYKTGLLGI